MSFGEHRRVLASALDSPQNSFNALRLCAAALVVVSHSFFILGGGNAAEPLSWSAYDLGAMAVNVFFVLSGMMISRSLDANADLARYVRARLLRIYPGIIFAGLITTFVIGPLGSGIPAADYFRNSDNWIYPFTVLYDFAGASLPGFEHGEHETNASLWTIKFELLAYLGCLLLAFLGMAHNRMVWITLSLGSGGFVAAGIGVDGESADAVASLFRFAFAFSLGALAYQWRHSLPLNLPLGVAAAVAAVLLGQGALGSVLGVVSIGYAALSAGQYGVPVWLSWTRHTDISFGLYLFGWPVQQALMHWFTWTPALVPLHIGMTLLLVVPLAWISWICVERPALSLK